ncbi:MAG: hypothetical protein J4F34_04395 [Gemmatimonadetes bacterium]|nr:hypothetical protein [Gemmatimonadota bacterium]
MPGFAGFHYEPGGSEDRMVVAMRRKNRDGFPSARSAVTGLMTASLGHTAGYPAFVQREVRYSFLELALERALLRGRIFALPGVVSLAVDEEANRIAIGVTDESAELEVMEVADALGVPHGMLAFEVGVSYAEPAAELRGFSPDSSLQAGYHIMTYHPDDHIKCTAGPSAVKGRGHPTTWFPPIQYFLINSHCSGIGFKRDTMTVSQPNLRDPVGKEVADPEVLHDKCGKIFKYYCRYSDAAVVKVDTLLTDRNVALGKIARTNGVRERQVTLPSRIGVDPENPTIEIVSVWGSAVKHEMLDKVGFRTGWTRGEVLETCDDEKFRYGGVHPDIQDHDSDSATVNILCSVKLDYINRTGDSGAPVFRYYSSTGRAQLRGIHFGHYGAIRAWMSPFVQLDKDLGSDRGMGSDWHALWFYDPGNPRSTWISGPRRVHPDAKPCTWRADADGGMTPFNYTWSGLFLGRSKTTTGKVEESGYLAVTFKDAIGREFVDSLEVSIDGSGSLCGGRPPPPPPVDTGIDTVLTPQ